MLTIVAADLTNWLRDPTAPAAGGSITVWAALLLAAVAAVAVAAAVVSLHHRDRAAHGPAFRRLGTALGVSPGQRRLLARIARASRLPDAGSLLVSRGCFDDAASRYVDRFGQSRRVGSLRATVFGGPDAAGRRRRPPGSSLLPSRRDLPAGSPR